MVVQHNLTAMNSNRMLGLTTKTQAKSTEKLSSGYKINRAADDAAGLAISEKMRKQIRGLTQASSNAQDGISAVQTAEGALTEVHDMLQRMNELAVKSANGTNSEDDRSYIQSEIDALVKEIDRVAETTKFNETYLLKGDEEAGTKTVYSYKNITVPESLTTGAGAEIDDTEAANYGIDTGAGKPATYDKTSLQGTVSGTYTGSYTGQYMYSDGTEQDDGGNNISAGWYLEDELLAAKANGGDKDNLTAADTAGLTFGGTFANGDTLDLSAKVTGGYKAFANAAEMLQAIKDGANIFKGDTATPAVKDTDYVYTKQSTAKAKLFDGAGNEVKASDIAEKLKDGDIFDEEGNAVDEAGLANFVNATTVNADLNLSLHVGADSTVDNKIQLDIASMSAAGIGVNDLDVSTEDTATNAVDIISEAIKAVSKQRSDLGAIQNRLEHTINNLDNVVENTTAAESQIRDTDMATEMVKYSNNNILAQAGQAMLAQSNQSNQGVLSLLG